MPAGSRALRLVRDCARDLGVDAVVIERVARYPSPTILVNGLDVMGVPGDGTPTDACRLDVPTREHVVEALRAAVL